MNFTEYANDSDDLEESQREDFELGFGDSAGSGVGHGDNEETQNDDSNLLGGYGEPRANNKRNRGKPWGF